MASDGRRNLYPHRAVSCSDRSISFENYALNLKEGFSMKTEGSSQAVDGQGSYRDVFTRVPVVFMNKPD